ncbi:MAG: MarR family winged helix-turn-helix transcriptional regulator [Acidimicrobiales bacterium]
MTLDARRLDVWRTFLQSHSALIELLSREINDHSGMQLRWYDVLLHLNEAGGSMRMRDLADSILLSKSGLTRLIDRMEEADYVSRQPCPADRRGTQAVLTEAGKAALVAAAPTHLLGIEEHFARLLPDDALEAVERFLARLAEHHHHHHPPACD